MIRVEYCPNVMLSPIPNLWGQNKLCAQHLTFFEQNDRSIPNLWGMGFGQMRW